MGILEEGKEVWDEEVFKGIMGKKIPISGKNKALLLVNLKKHQAG